MRDGGMRIPQDDHGGVDYFDWGLCDPDAPVGTTYRTGVGFESLVEALRDLTANEAEQTPEGFYPSGNIALYWSRKVRSDA